MLRRLVACGIEIVQIHPGPGFRAAHQAAGNRREQVSVRIGTGNGQIARSNAHQTAGTGRSPLHSGGQRAGNHRIALGAAHQTAHDVAQEPWLDLLGAVDGGHAGQIALPLAQVHPAVVDGSIRDPARQAAHIVAAVDFGAGQVNVGKGPGEMVEKPRIPVVGLHMEVIDGGLDLRLAQGRFAVIGGQDIIADGDKGVLLVDADPVLVIGGVVLEGNVGDLDGLSDGVGHLRGRLVQILQMPGVGDQGRVGAAALPVGKQTVVRLGAGGLVHHGVLRENRQRHVNIRAAGQARLGHEAGLRIFQAVHDPGVGKGPAVDLGQLVMIHGAGVGLAEAVLHGDLEGQGIGAGPGAVEGRRELFFIFDDDAGFQIVGGIGQRHVAAIVADPGPVVEASLFNAHILQIIGKIFPGNGLFAVKNRINTAAQGVIFDDPVVVPQFLVHAVGAQEPIGGLGLVVLVVGADVANGVGGNR